MHEIDAAFLHFYSTWMFIHWHVSIIFYLSHGALLLDEGFLKAWFIYLFIFRFNMRFWREKLVPRIPRFFHDNFATRRLSLFYITKDVMGYSS